jgi:uncharacterized protein (TIGR03083 family)
MSAASTSPQVVSAESIPYTNAQEAESLLTTAFDRFINLIESLAPADWSKPTPCTDWDVHDMVAHQAGGYRSGISYREIMRQYVRMPKRGQLPEDAINELQVGERKKMSPAELITELKQVGPMAIHNWAHGFRAIKWIHAPHPVAGWMSLRYLMWITHSRDTWMHRLDICRATNRTFENTREHDGRINELVVLDTARKLKSRLDGRSLLLVLTGIAGGTWQFGDGLPEAEIKMDALDFNIFASGRFSFEQGLQRATISGDRPLVEQAFKSFLVLY